MKYTSSRVPYQEAIVTKTTGKHCVVKMLDSGETKSAVIQGKLRQIKIRTTNPVAVGDKVRVLEDDCDDLKITGILPRKNYLIRKSVNLSKEAHMIAANIDQSILVASLSSPKTSAVFIDRFLIGNEAYGIPSTIVFNKTDLYTDLELAELDYWRNLYESIGYTVFSMSAISQDNLDPLRKKILGKSSVFSGHSGVGKSTILNALAPEDLNIVTGEISDYHLQGKHTTTFSEMYHLSAGTTVIDTPGIKGFGMVYISSEELRDYFIEWREIQTNCKFHNCSHSHEPRCAVLRAVEEERVPLERYENYLQLLEELTEDTRYR